MFENNKTFFKIFFKSCFLIHDIFVYIMLLILIKFKEILAEIRNKIDFSANIDIV